MISVLVHPGGSLAGNESSLAISTRSGSILFDDVNSLVGASLTVGARTNSRNPGNLDFRALRAAITSG